jgi:hypothetical protein
VNRSPVYKQGGWDSTKTEYTNIIHDIFAHPKYVKWFCERAASNSMEQVFTFSTGFDLPQNTPGTSPYGHIKLFFPGAIRQLELSKQFRGQLNYSTLNHNQLTLLILSILLFLAILFFYNKTISSPFSRIILIVLIGIFANAIVCGSFSEVDNRYQARVVWLFPFIVFLLLLEYPTIFSLLKRTFLGKGEPHS